MDLQKIQSEQYFRFFDIRKEDVNKEKRTIEISFSSEEEVERWYGMEILDHKKESVNLSRLNNSGALLLNHDTDKQIGVIEKAYISEQEQKGRAVVRFSRSGLGEEIYQDVLDGIRKNVSVGYRVEKLILVEKRKDVEVYRAVSWTPFEVSIVPIPADATVGVGRNIDDLNDIEKNKKEEAEQCQNRKLKITVRI